MRKLTLMLSVCLCFALCAGVAEAQKKGKGKGKGKGGPRPGAPAAATAAAPAAAPEAGGLTWLDAVNDDLTQKAAQAFEAARNRQIETLQDSFDDKMKQIPADKINEMFGQKWSETENALGPFKQVGGSTVGFRVDAAMVGQGAGMYDVRVLTLEFERGKLDLWVSFSPGKKLGGLVLLPPQMKDQVKLAVTAQAAQAKAAAAAAATAGRDQAVTVGAGTPWALSGTLTVPPGAGPFPAVVLVHGSGPQDRDETVGACKPFRDLAQGLSTQGVAVLRYEKRTKQHALECVAADKLTVKEETIDDALAAVALLKSNPQIDGKRIFVLGHSLGGMLIPRIAPGDASIAGFIVMAGTTRPLEDVILEQTTYLSALPGAATPEAKKNLEAVRTQVQQVKALQPGGKKSVMFIMGASPEYWLDLRGYDPAEAAKQIAKPMLILQGGRDYQVTMADYKRWQTALAGKPGVTFKLYADLNHLFVTGKSQSVPNEYYLPGQVAPLVISDIAAWVKGSK